jgi:hypothetical protein
MALRKKQCEIQKEKGGIFLEYVQKTITELGFLMRGADENHRRECEIQNCILFHPRLYGVLFQYLTTHTHTRPQAATQHQPNGSQAQKSFSLSLSHRYLSQEKKLSHRYRCDNPVTLTQNIWKIRNGSQLEGSHVKSRAIRKFNVFSSSKHFKKVNLHIGNGNSFVGTKYQT